MSQLSFKERARHTRELEILQQARRFISERGYANLNMDDLAEAVGISKPTLYQHFRSKEDLIAQVVIHDHEELLVHFDKPDAGTPLEQVEYLMRLMMRARYSNRGLFIHLPPDIKYLIHSDQNLTELREHVNDSMCALIERAKTQGEVEQTIPTGLITRAMFMLQIALFDPFKVDALPQEDHVVDENIDHLIRIFMQGITPRNPQDA